MENIKIFNDYPQKYPLKNNRVRLLWATPRLNSKIAEHIGVLSGRRRNASAPNTRGYFCG